MTPLFRAFNSGCLALASGLASAGHFATDSHARPPTFSAISMPMGSIGLAFRPAVDDDWVDDRQREDEHGAIPQTLLVGRLVRFTSLD